MIQLYSFITTSEEAGPPIDVAGLFPDGYNFVIALGTFAIIMVILYVFLWKHVVAFLDARQAHVENQLKTTAENNAKAEKNVAESQVRLESIHSESQQLMEAAKARVKAYEDDEKAKFAAYLEREKTHMEEQFAFEVKQHKAQENDAVLQTAVTLASQFLNENQKDTVTASLQNLQRLGDAE